MLNKYETIFILTPALDEEALAGQVEKYKKLIQDNGGEVTEVNEWGKRKLAYEVKDFNEGYYVLFKFNALPDLPKELERVYTISDEVLRYIVVREDE